MKRNKKWRSKIALSLLLLLMVGVFGAENVYANWHDITLKPGETYDCSKASTNTSVYINKPGTYTLKGKSQYVRVVISCSGVDCYLAGVDLNNGMYSNIGSRSSPMNIENNGGTIKLISKKGTKNYFEGYLNPGICKNGSKTKLVFETEDPEKPGTIEAKGGLDSAGIGCVMHVSATKAWSEPTGNIVINSGNIIARGGRSSAGIGGSFSSSLNGLTINGGNVKAYGNLEGAGIGAGYHGRAENITITGGTVYAETVEDRSGSAAIGGGGGYDYNDPDAYGKNITISGGEVTALSQHNGAAIGGGTNSDGKNITISGGHVIAKTTGFHSQYTPAIGGGGGRFPGDADVKITGGYVEATGGTEAPAIGSGGGQPGITVTSVVTISGGVVIAEKGPRNSSFTHNDIDIGTGTKHKDNVSTIIKGGSVYANKIENAQYSNGQKLHRVDVTCKDIGTRTDISYYLKDAVCTNGYSYGLNDVKLIHINENNRTGMFYPWLPDTDEKIKLTMLTPDPDSDNGEYRYGDFRFSALRGNLLTPTDIILKVGTIGPGYNNGYAIGIPGEKKLVINTMPTVAPSKIILGYASGSTEAEIVAEPDGTLRANTEFTNSAGEWICTDEQKSLNVITKPIKYKVHFDSNVPRNASTKNSLNGNMADQQFNYDEETDLTENKYDLPGYIFTGWKDKAGNEYADKTPVKNLTDKDGDVVTLYAQWTPMKYDLILDSGVAGKGQVTSPDMTFDAHETIPAVPEEWSDGLYSFICWKDENGNYYDDKEDFCNLVQYDANRNPVQDGNKLKGQTLTALWVQHGKIAATVTLDGQPEEGHGNHFHLIDQNTSTEYTPVFDYSDGIYTYTSPASQDDQGYIPPGDYYFSYDTGEQGFIESRKLIHYQLGSTASAVFDYYSVSIKKDTAITDAINDVVISGVGLIIPVENNTVKAPDDAKLAIGTNMNPGYHFDGYSALGTVPGNSAGTGPFDSSKPNQTIMVTGTSELMAHAEANVYTVKFDANANSGVTGEMEDQDMVYDQSQDLFANRFERVGGVFAGWNTKKDGSGDSYTDGQSVSNLTNKDGDTITLFAQWHMEQYDITYDLDGGQLPGDAFNPTKYTAADAFSLIRPEKTDYIFMGWIGTDCPSPEPDVTVPEGSAGDRDYTACWKIIAYNVTFKTNGGSEIDQQAVAIHQKAIKPEDPNREHYTFAGWYEDEDLTQPYDFSQEITEDITLYAKWEHITHSITYDLNGGTLDGKTGTVTVKAENGTVITLPAPTRDGYTFDYWEGSKYNAGDKYTVNEDHTFKAIWKTADASGDKDKNGGSSKKKGANTGDENSIVLWVSLMLIAAGGLTVMLRRSVKGRK